MNLDLNQNYTDMETFIQTNVKIYEKTKSINLHEEIMQMWMDIAPWMHFLYSDLWPGFMYVSCKYSGGILRCQCCWWKLQVCFSVTHMQSHHQHVMWGWNPLCPLCCSQVDRSGREQALVPGGHVRHPLFLHHCHHGLHLHVQVLHTPHRLSLQQGPTVDQPGALRPHVLHCCHSMREAKWVDETHQLVCHWFLAVK